MSLRPRPTRTPATVADYEKRALELFRMYARQNGITGRTGSTLDIGAEQILGIIKGDGSHRQLGERQLEPRDYREFAAWLGTARPGWTQTTWRQRRAQVSHWFETRPHPENDEAFAILADVSHTVAAKPKTKGSTSAKKPKDIPHEDWLALNTKLTEIGMRGNCKYGFATRAWLHANILLGLRPIEWVGAAMKPVSAPDDAGTAQFLVTVPNAKTTNGRGTGPTREFTIALTTEQAEIISTHLEVVAGVVGGALGDREQSLKLWRHFEGRCNRMLSSTCEALWPEALRKRYTLYSARHQFSANQKSDLLTPVE